MESVSPPKSKIIVDTRYLVLIRKHSKFDVVYKKLLDALNAKNLSWDDKSTGTDVIRTHVEALQKENKSFYYDRDQFFTSERLKELFEKHEVTLLIATKNPAKAQLHHILLSQIIEQSQLRIDLTQSIISITNKSLPESLSSCEYLVTYRPSYFINFLGMKPRYVIYVSSITLPVERKIKYEMSLPEFNPLAEISYLYQLSSAINSALNQTSKPIRCGYAFGWKKTEEMGKKNYLLSHERIHYIPLDLRVPTGRTVDIVLQKIQPYRSDWDDNTWKTIETQLATYEKTIKVIDPPSKFLNVSDRTAFQTFMQETFETPEFKEKLAQINTEMGENIEAKIPKMLSSLNKTVDTILSEVTSKELRFPVMLKIRESSSHKFSHTLGIATDKDGLSYLEQETFFKDNEHLIQELIPHDQTILKVYCIGKFIVVNPSPSLPNITDKVLGKNWALFETQKPFADQFTYHKRDKVEEKYNKKIVDLICAQIPPKFDLTLFGIDIIIDSLSGDYFVVDMNYFPGYKKVASFTAAMEENIIEQYNNTKKL